ncbi:hypothetical protein TNCV_3798211 [Trichonephila clavipes]|nr:hypothetical protein TNCV_3798211 [Trichonephila clavipes]
MPSCHSVHDLELAVQDLWAHVPQDNIRKCVKFVTEGSTSLNAVYVVDNTTCLTISDRGPRNSLRQIAGCTPVISRNFEHHAGDSTIWLGSTQFQGRTSWRHPFENLEYPMASYQCVDTASGLQNVGSAN